MKKEPMTKNPKTQYLKDLEKIFKVALEAGNLTAALKAKELLGKYMGFHESPKALDPKMILDMSQEELEKLIESLDALTPEEA